MVQEPSFELDDRTAAMVHTLIGEGALHRACTAPTSDPPVSPTKTVVEELQRQHLGPTTAHRDGIDELRSVGLGAVPAIDPDLVRKAPATFSSSPLTSHLQEALRHSSGDQTLRLLSMVVQMMLRGEIPEDVWPWVCGVSLMALREPKNSIRPVAVSDTLRRLCSKVAIELMGCSVRSVLEPAQVGEQTNFGCEAVVHTTRQRTSTFGDDPDRVLVLVDLGNAFNCVSRGAVLSAVRKHFPWLTPWADTCYRFDSNLPIGSSQIRSQRGVQQGDPLGPLFSLSLFTPASLKPFESRSPIILGILTSKPSSLMTGSSRAIRQFLTTLELRLREIGLDISRHKAEVVPACTSVQNFSSQDFEGYAWVPDGNIKLLGGAIGTRAWCESLLG